MVVLDPCCGTGSYVVEVLRRIEKTLIEKGKTALTANAVKKAAMERVFGFEIMPAPYVISHLQVGIALQQIGAPLSEGANERAAVYLTNSLTGWEPPTDPKQHIIAFPQLEQERDAAEAVKRTKPILVILGNPPYNAFAGVSPAEEMGLVEPYKKGLVTDWKIKKFNLDDLYVRFFRIAERRIAEQSKKGVVAFISNHSWISDPSFVVMRKHLLDSFDRFWIENLHGNRKISEYAPDGRTSETIFAVQGFSPGIQQGVATSLWVKTGKKSQKPAVLFRDDLNDARAADRRGQLVMSLQSADSYKHYLKAAPDISNRFSFRPSLVTPEYKSWPTVDLLAIFKPSLGILENRKEALVAIDRAVLEKRMRLYFDETIEWDVIAALGTGLTENAARFNARETRKRVLDEEKYGSSKVRRVVVRPMDLRWCYYTGVRPLWNESRPKYYEQCWDGNTALVTRRKGVANPEGVPFYFSVTIGLQHAMNTDAYYIPTSLRRSKLSLKESNQSALKLESKARDHEFVPNLSAASWTYLKTLVGSSHADPHDLGKLIWDHCLAIGYSPAYRIENADGIRQDLPRIPLPKSEDTLLQSAKLGSTIAALLNTEAPVPNVTTGEIRLELKEIAIISREGGGSLDPNQQHLALTAGWGHAGKGGIVMPGNGLAKVRDYAKSELTALENGAKKLGTSSGELVKLLGDQTMNIYLNNVAYWKNIPAGVWEYTIGGYQVIKKWLSYRERDLLKRDMKPEEIEEVSAMARRLAAIILLGPALDANYKAAKASTYDWPSTN